MATADRRRRKRDFRRLWITRITAACKMRGIMYSRLIHAMELKNVIINRKMLSEIAIAEPAAFDAIRSDAREAGVRIRGDAKTRRRGETCPKGSSPCLRVMHKG